MKKIFYSIITFITILLSTSCEKNDPLSISTLKPVVEGYLMVDRPIDIYISKQAPFSDSAITDLSLKGLNVQLEADGKILTLKDEGTGHYTSTNTVDSNKTYTLRFDYAGKTVTASTFVPVRPKRFRSSVSSFTIAGGFPPSFPDPLKLDWTSESEAYYLVLAQNTDASPEAVFSGGPFGGTGGNNQRSFRQSPVQGSSVELRSQLFSYYGNYNVILFRINAEYASLYADNGSSSLNLTTPYTNVTNGLGIFTGIASDTLKFVVKK
jgi:hypothetical protein